LPRFAWWSHLTKKVFRNPIKTLRLNGLQASNVWSSTVSFVYYSYWNLSVVQVAGFPSNEWSITIDLTSCLLGNTIDLKVPPRDRKILFQTKSLIVRNCFNLTNHFRISIEAVAQQHRVF
jgi:hypothetical protein